MATPDTVAGLTAWYQADAVTGIADGGEVAAWPDSSGNGYNTEQPFGLKPTYETGEVNALPVLRFGVGGDKAMRSVAPTANPQQTLIVVLRPAAGNSGERVLRGCDPGDLRLHLANGKPELVKSGTALIGTATTTLPTSGFSVVTAQFTAGTSWAIYLNGAADGSGSTTQTLSGTGTYTFIGSAGLFGGQGFIGDIAELITYSTALGDADRAIVHSYVQDKYGITVADYNGGGGGPPPVPTAPANVVATATAGQVALTWDASTDDVAVTGYRIYRRGTLLDTVTGATFTDTGLAGGVLYEYTVTAVDGDGNESDPSAVASDTTPLSLQPGAPSIIFDADMSTDIDDLGALAMLHALADLGECHIIGMVASSTNGGTSIGMDAVNTHYGRPDIPIGARPDTGGTGNYPAYIASGFPHDLASWTDCPASVDLYRQLLAAAPDNSVTILSTGFLTNLEGLLASPADGHSALAGPDLVALKVRELVMMGGTYPSGNEFNFQASGDDSAYVVVTNWPTAMTFAGAEVGGAIMTGGLLTTQTPVTNPIRYGWEYYNGGVASSSFDQVAVYVAVRPDDGLFGFESVGSNTVDPGDFSNAWVASPDPTGDLEQRYVLQVDADAAELVFDDLMMAPAAAISPGVVPAESVTGSGALTAPVGSLSGVGVLRLTGAGALAPAAGSLAAVGLVTATGSGTLVAAPATLSGAATITEPEPGVVTGSGTLTAASPTLAGAGTLTILGSGALTPTAPSLNGLGTLRLVGAGTLAAQAATLAGAGLVGDTGPARTSHTYGYATLAGDGTSVAVLAFDGASTATLTGDGTSIATIDLD